MTAPRIVIIGAGMSGICLAIRLKRAGIESFTILEKSTDPGGVWRDNTYPGAGCDIPSFLYTFSFAPNLDGKRRYARQPEIRDYFRSCAEQFGIIDHIEFECEVKRAGFDEADSVWRIDLTDGGIRKANILVSAVGQLSRPRIPEIDGLDSFSGTVFHSARWDHGCDLEDRRVAVIGSAASAVQLIPRIAGKARRVLVFQRSPNWISRFRDTAYPRWVRWSFRNLPGAARLHRWYLFWAHESRSLLNGKSTILNRCLTGWLSRSMRKRIAPEWRARLIPAYPAGCKRILLSNDYLETIQREDVSLIDEPINRVSHDAIETKSGTHLVDAIILATGFETGAFLGPIEIRGRGGQRLKEAWRGRPHAFLGMMVPEFPNFFMLYGPNTNLSHNSIIFMVECQVNYLLRCLNKLIADGCSAVEVRREAADDFDRRLKESLRSTVWTGPCANWYTNERGEVINNWSSSCVSYWLKTRRPDFRQLQFT